MVKLELAGVIEKCICDFTTEWTDPSSIISVCPLFVVVKLCFDFCCHFFVFFLFLTFTPSFSGPSVQFFVMGYKQNKDEDWEIFERPVINDSTTKYEYTKFRENNANVSQ